MARAWAWAPAQMASTSSWRSRMPSPSSPSTPLSRSQMPCILMPIPVPSTTTTTIGMLGKAGVPSQDRARSSDRLTGEERSAPQHQSQQRRERHRHLNHPTSAVPPPPRRQPSSTHPGLPAHQRITHTSLEPVASPSPRATLHPFQEALAAAPPRVYPRQRWGRRSTSSHWHTAPANSA